MFEASEIIERMPLTEKYIQNVPHTGEGLKNSLLTETPTTHKLQKITTPPETIIATGKRESIMETPTMKNYVQGNGQVIDESMSGKSALLSPAFSSPQQSFSKRSGRFGVSPRPSFSYIESDQEEDRSRPKKKLKKTKRQMKEMAFELDSNQKPPYSYATLIGMSILSNPHRKLTLSQIYQWISDTFKYYRRDEVGWQNSIRHNLSLNKAFIKGEKSKDGKGHFWCIQDGCEEQFLKVKNGNKKSGPKEVIDNIYSSTETKEKSIASIPSSPNVPYTVKEKVDFIKDGIVENINQHYLRDDFEVMFPAKKKFKSVELEDDSNNVLATPGKHLCIYDSKYDPAHSFLNHTLTPQVVVTESPVKPTLAGKNLTFTSSFSCNSNLELSPIHLSETGPLLEPLTPINNVYKNSGISNNHSASLSAYHIGATSSVPSGHPIRTPKTSIRTPLRTLKTPQTASIIKKIWHSPSYLEEFYYSPLISSSQGALASYDDDDMLMRALESPRTISKRTVNVPSIINSEKDSITNLRNISEKKNSAVDKHKTSSSNMKSSPTAELEEQ